MNIRWFYVFFLASGFCSLVHEVVWIRLAMARYGSTTPAISTVLSVFMAGLALGSLAAGRLSRRFARHGPAAPLRAYAAAELVIAVSALTVPRLFEGGRSLLFGLERGDSWGSPEYYLASGVFVAATLLPFCACMGATFPLAMAAIREGLPGGDRRSFSYLYLANVLGAASGTLISAYALIELLGFQGTLWTAGGLNLALAAAAFLLAGRSGPGPAAVEAPARNEPHPTGSRLPSSRLLVMLFVTGLASMAMELVWIRQFTPYLGAFVYTFASILAIYLGATAGGSWAYRRRSAAGDGGEGGGAMRSAWTLAGAAGLLPLLAADPRLPLARGALPGNLRIALGLLLFCGTTGYLTPLVVDRWAGGDPHRAGQAYAVNVLGCILGPLLAGFLLLPRLGERWSLILLALLLFALWWLPADPPAGFPPRGTRPRPTWPIPLFLAAASLVLVAGTQDFETRFPSRLVRRDYEATVIATGEGMKKQLLVNGYGMSTLTPATKMMVHAPLALRPAPPREALVICFGMGTSFRSALSWGVPTTAVELIPSVPSLFAYYHADGERLRRSPLARVVIDDGRRFLERTAALYDLVTIDPPPPVEAAGSSLLYSREFYGLIRRHLRPGGVTQQWLPWGDATTISSVTRALTDSFAHVRVFRSVEGWGMHFLCTMEPLPAATAATLASRMPAAAAADMLEWGPRATPQAMFETLLAGELPVDRLLAANPRATALRDDRPFNEYFLLRRTFGGER